MRKLTVVSILVLAFALPLFAANTTQTWQNVPLVDTHCYAKVKANPDSHERSCLMQCAKNGLGIIDSNGKFVKLDKTGQTKAMDLLKASDKKDSIRADVTGVQEGDTIKVSSISLK